MYSPSYYQEQLKNAKTPQEEHMARTNLKKANALHKKRKLQRIEAQKAKITNATIEPATISDAVITEVTVEDATKKRGRKPKEQ